MAKTPISILQEYTVSKKQHLPDYFIENCNDGMGSFKCTVRVGSIKAVGYACTKKEAKQNSAKKALEILSSSQNFPQQKSIAMINPSMPPAHFVGSSQNLSQENNVAIINRTMQPAHFFNFVGKLNELASTNGKPYPTYYEDPLCNANGLFTTRCSFLNVVAQGYGTKKKDAKQDAAKNVLNKLNNQDIALITIAVQDLDMENEKIKVELSTQDVLKSYNSLTTSTVDVTTLPTDFPSFKNIRKRIFSLEDFGKELEKYGYKYAIETFQKEPYVIMMKIKNTTITVMGTGKDKQHAINDLYENVVTMFDHGFTMTTTF